MMESALRVEVRIVDRGRLVEEEALVRSIFSVLSVAHYRSSPNDLQMMLEAPGHVLLAAFVGGAVAGALEAAVEPRSGGRGSGVFPDVFERMGWGAVGRGFRIVRVAVAPCIQRRGVGRALVSRLEGLARREGLSWVGASFGHHEPLGFWLRLGYIPVHVSPRFNPTTGEKNILVFKPLGVEAEEAARRASCSLLKRLVYSGSSVYRDVAAETIAMLLRGVPPWCPSPQLDREDLERLVRFLGGLLGYESVHDVLLRGVLVLHSRGYLHGLDDRLLTLISLLVVQGKPVYEAGKLLGVGRDEAERALRRVYQLILP